MNIKLHIPDSRIVIQDAETTLRNPIHVCKLIVSYNTSLPTYYCRYHTANLVRQVLRDNHTYRKVGRFEYRYYHEGTEYKMTVSRLTISFCAAFPILIIIRKIKTQGRNSSNSTGDSRDSVELTYCTYVSLIYLPSSLP